LVSRLLAFSRQTEAKLEPLNLYELSAEVVAMLRHSIDRRIEIRHELATPPLWLVEGDGSQLMQVLMNLCLNARDAMPNGGQLCIRLENITGAPPPTVPHQDVREFVRLTVSDTGEGMPPEVLSRLFEPYFTTKAVGKGTGLGLSIAHSVVTEHGGWMEVESKLGEGSHFAACFPRGAASPRELPQAPANLIPREERSLEGRETILVVDDDETVRLVVRAVLSYRGYQVTEACDGEEAVRRYEQTPGGFDLVLLDLNMPRLDGWDAMSRMQQLDPDVTIMLLSGGLTEGDIERAQRLGATTVLSKPFENPELVRLVRQTLDRAKRSAPASGTEPAGRSRGASACS
jgi:CheY-like chemotaxis protein